LQPSSTTITRGGRLLFAVLFALFTAFLLSQLTSETRFTPGKQLFAQPRFWPGASVIGMFVFGLGYVISLFINRDDTSGGVIHELAQWLKSFEYFAWFMAYVFAVPVVGYLPTTLLFMFLITLRLGYRSKKTITAALLCGFLVVLLFKTGLSVNIPGGAIYEYLPKALRSFMISHF